MREAVVRPLFLFVCSRLCHGSDPSVSHRSSPCHHLLSLSSRSGCWVQSVAGFAGERKSRRLPSHARHFRPHLESRLQHCRREVLVGLVAILCWQRESVIVTMRRCDKGGVPCRVAERIVNCSQARVVGLKGFGTDFAGHLAE